MKRILLICLMGLMGCATTGKYEEHISLWVGHDVNDLLAGWGAPTNTFEMPNGSKMYVYQKTGESVTTRNQMFSGRPVGSYSTSTYYCNTTFITNKENVITNWKWEGNSCKST